jgi:hypothetical protein
MAIAKTITRKKEKVTRNSTIRIGSNLCSGIEIAGGLSQRLKTLYPLFAQKRES